MAWSFCDDKPIFQQIVDTITVRILRGQYKAGDKLPTVRDFAVEAGVNPNTMQRALNIIEETGIIYTRRGDGRYVSENTAVLEEIREQYVKETVNEFLANLLELGLDEDSILNAITQGLNEEG